MTVEIERKFLVACGPPGCEWPVPFRESTISQTYLLNEKPGVAERIRRRHYLDNEQIEFTHTVKTHVGPGHNEEEERKISEEEYLRLGERADSNRTTLLKIRWVFDWQGRTFELDIFMDLWFSILEVELPDLDAPMTLPPWIEIEKEVTGDKHWSNFSLSLGHP